MRKTEKEKEVKGNEGRERIEGQGRELRERRETKGLGGKGIKVRGKEADSKE